MIGFPFSVHRESIVLEGCCTVSNRELTVVLIRRESRIDDTICYSRIGLIAAIVGDILVSGYGGLEDAFCCTGAGSKG